MSASSRNPASHIAARHIDGETKTIIIGFSTLGPLALLCLLIIGYHTWKFLTDPEVREMRAPSPASAVETGRKGHLVGAGALMA